MVWRNPFFPAEILNALGVRMLTVETYAALRARSGRRLQEMLDRAARKLRRTEYKKSGGHAAG